jgi:hypothetical protein
MYLKRCMQCGTEISTTSKRGVICDECKEIARKERDHLRYLKRRILKPDPDALVIIKDPDILGGFHQGAVIKRWEAVCMCRSNYKSFTPGTILKDSTGKYYKIINLIDGRQELEPIRKAA